ncbi:MAG: hypothetical protein EP306_11690 [Burkholderiales bacterium]|nr:MAG: hypothetical protein EP306_11690 [Burkholderiales bacterium]
MKNILHRLLIVALVPALTLVSLPVRAQAGLISTEEVVADAGGQAARDKVADFLARDDVRQALEGHGVAGDEALERVRAMSDAEVAQLAQRVDEVPAGGDVLGLLFTVFVILLVTDILGFTKVFPFTRSVR